MSLIPSIVVNGPFEEYEDSSNSHGDFVQVQALRNEIGENIIDDCLSFMNTEVGKSTNNDSNSHLDLEALKEISGPAQSPDFQETFVSVNNVVLETLKVWDARSYEEIQETYSSSSSRRSSYCSSNSPADYQSSLEQNLENELYPSLIDFPNWQDETCENFDVHFDNSIDNTELNLVDEVIRDQAGEIGVENQSRDKIFKNQLENSRELFEKGDFDSRVADICDSESYINTKKQKTDTSLQSESVTGCTQEDSNCDTVNVMYESSWNISFKDAKDSLQSNFASFPSARATESLFPKSSKNLMSNLVASPYQVLNLPSTKATEKLIREVDPNDVMRAMKDILKIPTEDLTRADNDGDTMLMCLVGNPEEVMKKKAYLLPLVERLSSVKGALSCINNHGKDALYLASINCPQIPEIAGYLAATLLQKGVDINQRLHHSKGDTLVHAVAGKGDTHKFVLAELLPLKTPYGNFVFDFSKRNHEGKTALHLAVESHESNQTSKTSLETVSLLLKNGIDPCITEIKYGNSALHTALISNKSSTLIKVLLTEGGAKAVNIQNYDGNTPLHLAAMENYLTLDQRKIIRKYLLRAGGELSVVNQQGATPLILLNSEPEEIIKTYLLDDYQSTQTR